MLPYMRSDSSHMIPRSVRQYANKFAASVYQFAVNPTLRVLRREVRDAYLEGWKDGQAGRQAPMLPTAIYDDELLAALLRTMTPAGREKLERLLKELK